MKREIRGQINTFLLNRNDLGDIYFGVSSDPFISLNRLNSQKIQKNRMVLGLQISYETSDEGEFEIISYPQDFGQLSAIFQNNIDINILEAWNVTETKQNNRKYYMYYTKLPQYDDSSLFMFKI